MVEFRKAKLATGEEIEIPEPVALEPARLFKATSDAIRSRARRRSGSFAYLHSVLSPNEARKTINNVVGAIDPVFVVSGTEKTIMLDIGPLSEEIEIGPDLLANPATVMVFTDNFDTNHRDVDIEGLRQRVELIDGLDYRRKISVMIGFDERNGHPGFGLYYSSYRTQSGQDRPTDLSLFIAHPLRIDLGTSQDLAIARMTEQHEVKFIELAQALGGITLPT